MYHFFVDSNQAEDEYITIAGEDYNHIKNVLRMKNGDEVLISFRGDEDGSRNKMCAIDSFEEGSVVLKVLDKEAPDNELPCSVTIFQGLPKSDKMELIIQKCVELGAVKIVPVTMKRCIMKLDEKKEDSKLKRWNAISESAAKQSKRSVIPEVSPAMSYKNAVALAAGYDLALVPYENEEGMAATRRLLGSIKPGNSIAVFIGPEGGFDEREIELAKSSGLYTITLGKRILRTETAGISLLSMIAYATEE